MSLTQEEIDHIRELAAFGMARRAIARKLGRNVKSIRAALGRPVGPREPNPLPNPPGKLESFKEQIRELVAQELTATRILREIRGRGYQGSLTILKEFVNSVRGPRKPQRRVFQRFETPPAQEAQVDWSPYRVSIAGRPAVIHCFSMIAAHSRYQFMAFYRNEKLTTLLHAHVEAFQFMNGIFRRVLYDNMTAVTLGRSGGQPIWNPTFLPFAKHYGFEPRVCRPRDPNRKGKVERPFWYIEQDFIKAKAFVSWEDLNAQAREWLDTVANVRVHATTKQVPRDMFVATEQPLLIDLPSVGLAIERREVRKIQTDGMVSVDGSFYPAPASCVGQYVTVLVDPHRVRMLNAAGEVIAAHAIPDRPMRVEAPAAEHSQTARSALSRPALEAHFLAKFPESEEFLQGLQRRMNALTPIHLRKIEKLVELYGLAAVQQAMNRAQHYRNFSAVALDRILQSAHPHIVDEPPLEPMTADPAALGALDGIDSGAPEDYRLDDMPATHTGDDDASQTEPE